MSQIWKTKSLISRIQCEWSEILFYVWKCVILLTNKYKLYWHLIQPIRKQRHILVGMRELMKADHAFHTTYIELAPSNNMPCKSSIISISVNPLTWSLIQSVSTVSSYSADNIAKIDRNTAIDTHNIVLHDMSLLAVRWCLSQFVIIYCWRLC